MHDQTAITQTTRTLIRRSDFKLNYLLKNGPPIYNGWQNSGGWNRTPKRAPGANIAAADSRLWCTVTGKPDLDKSL